MRTASIAQVKAGIGQLVRQSTEGPIIITRNGKPVAALVAMDDEAELERLVFAHSPHLRSILDAANARIEAGQGITHEEFWRRAEKSKVSRPRKKAKKKSA